MKTRYRYHRKNIQKSNPVPGTCSGTVRHTAGKRKNHPISRIIIAKTCSAENIYQ